MITTDTAPPVAMFVSSPSADASTESTLVHTAEEGTYPNWFWLREEEMPELPISGHVTRTVHNLDTAEPDST